MAEAAKRSTTPTHMTIHDSKHNLSLQSRRGVTREHNHHHRRDQLNSKITDTYKNHFSPKQLGIQQDHLSLGLQAPRETNRPGRPTPADRPLEPANSPSV